MTRNHSEPHVPQPPQKDLQTESHLFVLNLVEKKSCFLLLNVSDLLPERAVCEQIEEAETEIPPTGEATRLSNLAGQ